MSAVSAESPRGSADLTNSSASSAEAVAGPKSSGSPGRADFGPNQWLVDELYQRYQADPGSVDQAWWSFFADYQPQPDTPGQAAQAGSTTTGVPAGNERLAQAAGQHQPGCAAGAGHR